MPFAHLRTTVRRLWLAAALALAVVGAAAAAAPAWAAGPIWLDAPLQRWSGPASGVPKPPVQTNTRTGAPLDIGQAVRAICRQQERGPLVEEEKQVSAAGWYLESYWPPVQAADVTVVTAVSWYDGMCRPWAYQALMFVGGRFAGTVSPVTMNSRFDGMLDRPPVIAPGPVVEATFTRYAERDALCCPSLPKVLVRYELTAVGAGRVFAPTSAAVLPLPPQTPARLPSTGDSLDTWALTLMAAGMAAATVGYRLRRTPASTQGRTEA
jgi:LPXTG-motif cell wall-anchored protein